MPATTQLSLNQSRPTRSGSLKIIIPKICSIQQAVLVRAHSDKTQTKHMTKALRRCRFGVGVSLGNINVTLDSKSASSELPGVATRSPGLSGVFGGASDRTDPHEISRTDEQLALVKMGSKASILLQDSEIEEIQKETGFSHNQIVRLYSRFTSLDKSNNGYLCREDFLRIPELAINPLGDRIVNAFYMEENEEVNFRQFMRTLARFRPIKENKVNELNSREQKLQFAFKMYDLDGDNKISREELLAVLHMMVGANISEEQLGSIADRTIAEADQDGDGKIAFDEFTKVMERVDVEQKMSIRFLN